MRDRVAFGVAAVVTSLALYGLMWWGRSVGPPLVVSHLGLLVPAVAIMAVAFGVGWRRKAAFVAATVAGSFPIEWAASAAGVSGVTRSVNIAREPVAFVAWLVYAGLVVAFPLAMLVLFVGRRPSRLWSRE